MNRRYFFLSVGGLAALARSAAVPPRITRISFVPVAGRFHKFIAMNSGSEKPLGETYQNTLVRIATDRGVEGVSVAAGRAPSEGFAEDVRSLLGVNPLAIFRMEDGRISGRSPQFETLLTRHRHLDGPLFDLIGKLTERPCWQLLGKAVRDRIEVYDGTFYFTDVWFKDRGVPGLVEEAKEAIAAGYGGMKFKVGRGYKWMEKAAGLKRDLEVLSAVREAVGPKPKILVDANNAYRDDPERAWSFLSQAKDINLYWLEEAFPEDVKLYTRLRQKMGAAKLDTLIADGESADAPEHFRPFLEPRKVLDVVQLNIRVGGFLGGKRLAEMAEKAGAVAVPHNWASRVGLYMSLHLAKAVPNVVGAEDDRSSCDAVLVDDGYRFEDGHYTVSDSPGLGLHVNEEVYRDRYQTQEVVV